MGEGLAVLPAQCHRSLLDPLQQITTFAHQQVGGIGDMGEVFVAGGVEADAGHGFQQVAGGLEALVGAGFTMMFSNRTRWARPLPSLKG
ncbi:hypothetical protein HX808_09695 [Pseudomonas gingeri]|nr:hypothetical protein [Pseudomonas gingeri]